ncbi:MAG: hypothetical protein MSG64_01535 [Pyrinomonadaceae bacterium MAG19_C2-C3]|nr:hypothetical protein [Pyrinomonadaceae bacterium MAG19_C2-C3]
MNDTDPEIEARVREMMMRRSGEERFIMGALMFDAAREIVIASLPKDLPEDEFKRLLFERIYGCSMREVIEGADISDEEFGGNG